jgi:hypothetical protein
MTILCNAVQGNTSMDAESTTLDSSAYPNFSSLTSS